MKFTGVCYETPILSEAFFVTRTKNGEMQVFSLNLEQESIWSLYKKDCKIKFYNPFLFADDHIHFDIVRIARQAICKLKSIADADFITFAAF